MRCPQTLYAKNKAKYYSYGGDENPFVYVIWGIYYDNQYTYKKK